jgi:hypothetical protein
MLRFTRFSGFKSKFNTFLLIHNSLNTFLRGHINELIKIIILGQFLTTINIK